VGPLLADSGGNPKHCFIEAGDRVCHRTSRQPVRSAQRL
jgi:hypothetical protein